LFAKHDAKRKKATVFARKINPQHGIVCYRGQES
jgi:hypothetical protein